MQKNVAVPKNLLSNTQALCIIDSNLSACGIPHQIITDKNDIDVRVRHVDGRMMNVSIAVAPLAQPVSADIVVPVEDVMSLDREKSLEAFYSITEPLGWGRPVPVDRGPKPSGKTRDINLLVIRHCEWRNAPNLSEALLAQLYDGTIRQFARMLLKRDSAREVLANAGEDFDSLCQIGRIVAMNFHHKYRDVRASKEINERNFAQHLKQRYSNAVQQWRKQHLNVFPDDQTLSISTTGTLDGDAESYDPTVEQAVDLLKMTEKELSPDQRKARDELVQAREQYDESLPQANPFGTALDSYILTLRHDERLALLSEHATKDDRFCDVEVKALAKRKLADEQRRCELPCCEEARKALELEEPERQDEEEEDPDLARKTADLVLMNASSVDDG